MQGHAILTIVTFFALAFSGLSWLLFVVITFLHDLLTLARLIKLHRTIRRPPPGASTMARGYWKAPAPRPAPSAGRSRADGGRYVAHVHSRYGHHRRVEKF